MPRQSIRLLWNIILYRMISIKCQTWNVNWSSAWCVHVSPPRPGAGVTGGSWLMSWCSMSRGDWGMLSPASWCMVHHQSWSPAHLITSSGHKTPVVTGDLTLKAGPGINHCRHKLNFPTAFNSFSFHWYYYCPIWVSLLNWILNGGWHEDAHKSGSPGVFMPLLCFVSHVQCSNKPENTQHKHIRSCHQRSVTSRCVFDKTNHFVKSPLPYFKM